MKLVKYEATRKAIAECKTVGDAIGLLDELKWLEFFSRVINEKPDLIDACELVIRCERRLGQLVTEVA